MTQPEGSLANGLLERPATIFEQLAMDVALLKSAQGIERCKDAPASEAFSSRSDLLADSLASRSPCASAHREFATPHSGNASSRDAEPVCRSVETLDQRLWDEIERVSNMQHERNSSLRTLLTDALEALSLKFQHRCDALESSICTHEAELREECDRVVSISEIRTERMRSEHGDALVALESRLREVTDRPQHRLCTIPELDDFEAYDEGASVTPRSFDVMVRGELDRVSRSIAGLEALLQQHNAQYVGSDNTFAASAPASPREENGTPSRSWAPGTPREAGSQIGVDVVFAGWAPGTLREEKDTDCSVDLSSPRQKGLEVVSENVEAKWRSEIDLICQAQHVLQDLVGVHHAHLEGEIKKLGAVLIDQMNDQQIHLADKPSVRSAIEEVNLGEHVPSRCVVASRTKGESIDELMLVSQTCESRHFQLQKDLAALEARIHNEMEAKLVQNRAEHVDRLRDFLATSSAASTPAARTRSLRTQVPGEQDSVPRTPAERILFDPQEDSDVAPGSGSRENSRIADLRGKIAKLRRGGSDSDDTFGSGSIDVNANARCAVETDATLSAVEAAVVEVPGTFTPFGSAFAEKLEKMGAHCSREIQLR